MRRLDFHINMGASLFTKQCYNCFRDDSVTIPPSKLNEAYNFISELRLLVCYESFLNSVMINCKGLLSKRVS